MPETFILVSIAPNTYVEVGTDEPTHVTLREAMDNTESAFDLPMAM